MGRDSSGTYTRTQSDYSFNTVISETQINSELNDIKAEITASLEASGKKTWTGNQNAGSTKITALAVGSALTDSTTLGQVQNGGAQYAAGTGTDTITATMAPAITAYTAGQTFRIKQAAGANTGATTLNLNSVGAKAITKRGTTALGAGDIPASTMFEVAYDGTQFQLINVGMDHGDLLASNNLSDVGTAATALTNLGGIGSATTDTLTNKSINLANNTLTSTLAQLNTAISDATLVSDAITASSTETLTNKTIGAFSLDATPGADHTAVGPQTNTLASGYSSAVMDLVYLGSASKWLEADADASGTSINLLGIALEAKTDTQAMAVALSGSFVRDDTWSWTPGVPLYISGTIGEITATKPTGSGDIVRTVGYAVTADIIFFAPSSDYVTLA